MNETELIEKRFADLADQSYTQGRYVFSNFLDLNEQSIFYAVKNKIQGVSWKLTGGYEGAERRMLCFGSEEEFGYEQEAPIRLLHVKPGNAKFSQPLNHRDYLGALMHLGIERNMIGDIITKDQEAYVFVKDQIGPFLMQEWTKVRNSCITITEEEIRDFDYQPEFEEIRGFCASLRVDVVVGLLCRISRKESSDLIKAQKVFLNSRLVESNSRMMKEGDIFSVRGYGKAVFSEVTGQSKKGRYAVLLKKYV